MTSPPALVRPLRGPGPGHAPGVALARARFCAYAAAVAFTIGLSRFALGRVTHLLDDGHPLGTVVAALPHVLLLVGVLPYLPARRAVRASGAFWLILDLTSDVLALVGLPGAVYLTVRFVGHIGAAVWLIGTSRDGSRALRWIAVVTGIYLGAYSCVAAWLPPVVLAPSGPLLIAWCVLVGRSFAHA